MTYVYITNAFYILYRGGFIKNKDIRIVLHLPDEQNNVDKLNNVHNEMIANIVRNYLQKSGLSKEKKKEYLNTLIKTVTNNE